MLGAIGSRLIAPIAFPLSIWEVRAWKRNLGIKTKGPWWRGGGGGGGGEFRTRMIQEVE